MLVFVRAGRAGVRRWLPPLLFGLVAIVSIMGTIAGLAVQADAAARPCEGPGSCPFPALDAASAALLAASGVSLAGYAVLVTVLASGLVCLVWALGAAVAWRGQGSLRWLIAGVWFALPYGSVSEHSPWPVFTSVLVPLGLIGFFWLLALFPTQTLEPRWVAVPATAASIWAVVTFGLPPVADALARQESPWWQLTGLVANLCLLGILAAQLVRFRRADSDVRRRQGQLLIALGLVLFSGIVGAVLAFFPDQTGPGTLAVTLPHLMGGLMFDVLLLVLAAATLRDGLYGVRGIVDHVLFAGVLLGVATTAYGLLAAGASLLGTGVGAAAAGIGASLGLAVAYVPVRRGIRRLVYGEEDAAAVVAALSAAVASASSPATVLSDVLHELTTRLHLPAATLATPRGTTTVGNTTLRPTETVPLDTGTLMVALRPGQHRLTRHDRTTIRATSGVFAAADSVRRLSAEAHAAREALAQTRELERAQLARRLHDGVGPGLAVARHLIEAGRDDKEPERGRAHLDAAEAAILDALTQVRALSRELRPPVLDALPLGEAIARFANHLGATTTIRDDTLGTLKDDQKTALYRIAVEAVVNAVRHGAATSFDITISRTGDHLELAVRDDGAGITTDAAAGIGLTTMRERATELGGHLHVGPAPERGTLVICRIPTAANEEGAP